MVMEGKKASHFHLKAPFLDSPEGLIQVLLPVSVPLFFPISLGYRIHSLVVKVV